MNHIKLILIVLILSTLGLGSAYLHWALFFTWCCVVLLLTWIVCHIHYEPEVGLSDYKDPIVKPEPFPGPWEEVDLNGLRECVIVQGDLPVHQFTSQGGYKETVR